MTSRRSAALLGVILAGWFAPARAIPVGVAIGQLVDRQLLDHGTRAVTQIAQTPDGTLWFGSNEGLSHFDGLKTRKLSRDANGTDLPGGTVTALYVLRDGGLLVGTDNGQALVSPDHLIHPVPSLDGEAVHAAVEVSDGGIYVGTSRGLFHRAPAATAFSRVDEVGLLNVLALAAPGGDEILVGAAEQGLLRLRGGRVVRRWSTDLRGLARSVRAILHTARGKTLLATSLGIELLDGDTVAPLSIAGWPGRPVLRLAEDEDGTIWVAADTQGLYRIGTDRATNECGAWCEAEPMVVFRAASGELVVGTVNSGVHILRASRLTTIGKPEGLPADPVLGSAIIDGKLWVGLAGHGTWRATISPGPSVSEPGPVYAADRAPMPALTSGLRSPWGKTLVGTERGVYVATQDGVGTRIEPIGDASVVKLVQDGTRVLVATARGLYTLDEHGATVVPEFRGAVIRDVLRASPSLLWVATANRGLAKVEAAGITWFDKGNRLQSNDIGALWAHGDDLWFVEYDGSPAVLVRLSGSTLSRLGTEQGIPDVTLLQVWREGEMVWGCAEQAIIGLDVGELDHAAHDPRTRVHARTIDVDDGLRGTCFELSNTPRRDEAGRVWFNTARGLAGIDPAAPISVPAAAKPRVEDLVVDAVHLPVTDGAALTLPAGAHRVELHYSAFTLWKPHQLSFRYRLDGVDHDWQRGDESLTAIYTDPPPGTHRFTVQVAYDFAFDRPESHALDLHVTPRLHQRLVVQLALGLSVLALIWLGFRLRVRALERRGRWLTTEVAARTRDLEETRDALMRAERLASVATLARGIAHELNNPLGTLQNNLAPLGRYTGFLAKAAAALKARFGGTAEELDRIVRLSPTKDLEFVVGDLEQITAEMSSAATRARRIIGDLGGLGGTATRPVEFISVERVVADTLRLFTQRLPAEVKLTSTVAPDLSLRFRAGELEQVLINLVENALFAVGQSGQIHVFVTALADGIELTVADDGVGMTEEVRTRATRAFFTTRPPGEGSGLGLAVVSSIAGRDPEDLTIVSAPGEGTRVRIRLHSVPERAS